MSNLTPRIDRIERSAFGSEIEVGKIPVPHTTITNEQGQPRQISDLANNMKVSMGVERVMIAPIEKLNKEFGPNKVPVWQMSNKDERIRFVGTGWSTRPTNNGGNDTFTNTVDDYLEIVFYGTGLNLLTYSNTQTIVDQRVTVDDQLESSNIYVADTGVINGRNYSKNMVKPIVSGLDLGVHTVKIRMVSTYLTFFGYEIINETSQLVVNPGKPRFNQKAQEITSQQLVDYNSGFDAQSDTLGSKGGRVLVYQAADGSINKRLTATDPQITIGDPTELVTNGDFSTGDLTGWVTDTATGGTVVVNGSNQAVLTLGSSFGTRARLAQQLTTTASQKYTIAFDIIASSGTGELHLNIWTDNTRTTKVIDTNIYNVGSSGQKSVTFTATTTTTYIEIAPEIQFSTSFTTDNFSVKETAYDFLALSATDHSKEEIIRTISFREFSSNFATDFGVENLPTSGNNDRAFTLDDGTTTLLGNNIYGHPTNAGLTFNDINGYFVITFVGTGLDIEYRGGTVVCGNVYVDGINVGTWAQGDTKICSGLPYGTHTVWIDNSIYGAPFSVFENLIVYGPKKPELSQDELELADYNIMADYDNSLITAHNSSAFLVREMSQGVIRKMNTREYAYTGTSNVATVSTAQISGYTIGILNTNSSAEYSFFGTGFVFKVGFTSTGIRDFDILVDGVPNDSAVLLNGNGTNEGGGNYTVPNSELESFEITGLPLGLHTVKIVIKTNAGTMYPHLEIITPIHINDSSFKVGNLSLSDKRKAADIAEENKNKIDWTRAKALLVYDQNNFTILYSKNISAVVESAAGQFFVYFKHPFKDKNSYTVSFGGNLPEVEIADATRFKNHLRVIQRVSGGGSTDSGWITMAFFGELENEEDIDLEDL